MNAQSQIASEANVTIELEELCELFSRGTGVVVAEVLPASYYESGHLPGARHLPLDRFELSALEIAPDKRSLVIVYCASNMCANSDVAARRLRALGYTRVRIFRGGKAAWAAAGFPLVKRPA